MFYSSTAADKRVAVAREGDFPVRPDTLNLRRSRNRRRKSLADLPLSAKDRQQLNRQGLPERTERMRAIVQTHVFAIRPAGPGVRGLDRDSVIGPQYAKNS